MWLWVSVSPISYAGLLVMGFLVLLGFWWVYLPGVLGSCFSGFSWFPKVWLVCGFGCSGFS